MSYLQEVISPVCLQLSSSGKSQTGIPQFYNHIGHFLDNLTIIISHFFFPFITIVVNEADDLATLFLMETPTSLSQRRQGFWVLVFSFFLHSSIIGTGDHRLPHRHWRWKLARGCAILNMVALCLHERIGICGTVANFSFYWSRHLKFYLWNNFLTNPETNGISVHEY